MNPDVLLILGTSLHVHGLKTMVKEFAKAVHAKAGGKGRVIFVNLSRPSESLWKGVLDCWVSMDCDAWVDSMRRRRPDMFQIQPTLKAQVKKTNEKVIPKAIADGIVANKSSVIAFPSGSAANHVLNDCKFQAVDGLRSVILKRRRRRIASMSPRMLLGTRLVAILSFSAAPFSSYVPAVTPILHSPLSRLRVEQSRINPKRPDRVPQLAASDHLRPGLTDKRRT